MFFTLARVALVKMQISDIQVNFKRRCNCLIKRHQNIQEMEINSCKKFLGKNPLTCFCFWRPWSHLVPFGPIKPSVSSEKWKTVVLILYLCVFSLVWFRIIEETGTAVRGTDSWKRLCRLCQDSKWAWSALLPTEQPGVSRSSFHTG